MYKNTFIDANEKILFPDLRTVKKKKRNTTWRRNGTKIFHVQDSAHLKVKYTEYNS